MDINTRRQVEIQIEELIDTWAKTLDEDDFIEALEEMEDHACTAAIARREELE